MSGTESKCHVTHLAHAPTIPPANVMTVCITGCEIGGDMV